MSISLRIAVADDELDIREYFQKILPRLGHHVVGVAGNGQELVALCQQQTTDLIITDINMPHLGGVEATRILNEDSPIPVILISAWNEPELLRRAENEHVMCYLVKPIKYTDLEPAIALAMQRFLERVQLRQECQELRKQLFSQHPDCISAVRAS